MKIAGIIAEYNPFHNGHLYHIEETKRRTGCDALIVVMSGDFVQRGVPAVTDRYLRAEAALRCGADVVLELPAYGATASAEDFALAGVRALTGLSCVDVISYGAEDAGRGTEMFRSIAQFLLDEPGAFKQTLLAHVREGNSYAKARSMALAEFFPEAAELLAKPNNILAVEYEKAILTTGSAVATCAISRSDLGYHDTTVDSVCSATAIRNALAEGGLIPAEAVPAEVLPLYSDITATSAVTADDFSDMLFAELSSHTPETLSAVYDVPADLANRILEQAQAPFTWTSLAESVKCKAYTRSRIDRALCHCLLHLTAAGADIFREGELPYLRVLGFRKDAEGLISAMERSSRIPLLVRFLRDSGKLQGDAADILATDLRASALYSQVLYKKTGVIREDTHRRLLTV
jgi:Predicted nucleotidyltransferase